METWGGYDDRIVATNVIASQPPERQPTATPTLVPAPLKLYFSSSPGHGDGRRGAV